MPWRPHARSATLRNKGTIMIDTGFPDCRSYRVPRSLVLAARLLYPSEDDLGAVSTLAWRLSVNRSGALAALARVGTARTLREAKRWGVVRDARFRRKPMMGLRS